MAKKEIVKTEKEIKGAGVIVSESFNLIKKPCITEKAAFLSEGNVYTFKVDRRSNKIQIKDFIQKKYNVHVELVRIINVPEKPKKRGGIKGSKAGYKKALIRIKAGELIDLTAK